MRFLLLLVCCVSALAADAPRMRLCTLDKSFEPYTRADGNGVLQRKIRRVAAKLGLQVHNVYAPRARCVEQLRSTAVDALIGAYTEDRLTFAVYPSRGGLADPSRALVRVMFRLYVRRDSTLSWEGEQFSFPPNPVVGVQAGFTHIDRMRATGARVDDGARTTEQNLGKLMLGRLDAALAMETEAAPLLEGKYAGVLKALPQPFEETHLYLLVSRTFYQQHKQLVEALWRELALVPSP
ncbi:transporter substrate-binding domain-containing protein [Burkholderiaceae bacterium DAT-1]|nr:transporter substrate-binding domain-containing protein [Burkholderiaceae bacterium DAT-1]